MYKSALFLITSLVYQTNPVNAHCNDRSPVSDIPQTRAQVHTLQTDTVDSATVDTDNLFCNEAEIEELLVKNAAIKNLTVEHLRVNTEKKSKGIEYSEHIFNMRDFFRVGSTGFKAVRTIKNTSDFPLLPRNEIRGWKMTDPSDKSNDNAPLYVTDYIPNTINSEEANIVVEAHFIIPKLDAPEEGIEQSVKLGVWIDCIHNQSHIQETTPCFFESNDTLIPTKNKFGSSKIAHFTVRTVIPSHMITNNFVYILLQRIAVSEDNVEFNHKQGITLNKLIIQYPVQ